MRTLTLSLFALVLLAPVAWGDDKKKADAKAMTADEFAKEFATDKAKAEKKYEGKTVKVSGTVGDVYDDILYLPTKVTYMGDRWDVCVRYDKAKKPAVKKGDTATFEGTFSLVAVLGPSLKDARLVTDGKK